ncbi:MAG: IPT/TIG domain-containing protein [Kofleriaceae bacterium]
MAFPSITSITPSSGPTGGGVLVEIAGADFQLPAPAVSSSPAKPQPPTVRVLIGERAARGVCVFSENRLTCIVPAGDPGAADVVVQNVDVSGTPIEGEMLVAPQAFIYVRHPLTAEADLTRLVRTLLRELKRQVLDNVVLTVQTDFDVETGAELHLAQIATLPALVLVGPELSEDRFFSLNQSPELADGPGRFTRRRVPYTVDLGFTLVGASDHTTELLNLMAATQLFFHRTKYLEMDRDPANAAAGGVRYEMDLTPDGDLKVTSQPNESNVRSFSGRLVVRGFDLEDLAGIHDEGVVERGAVVEAVVVETSRPLASHTRSSREQNPGAKPMKGTSCR